MKKGFSYIDLFAGAGGMSIGFGNAGFELEFANDFAKDAVNTFRENLGILHPGMDRERIIYGDITQLYEMLGTGEVTVRDLGHKVVETRKSTSMKAGVPDVREDQQLGDFLATISEVDVICGGPPCQGFSMIGRSKRGTKEERMQGFVDDPRNQLFMYYLKFVEKLNPKIVLIENVSGLGSAQGYKDLIEEQLSSTGNRYQVKSEVLNAADFGIPQHRERMFFIGVREDIVNILPDYHPEKIFGKILKRKNHPVSLMEAIGDLPKICANPVPNNYGTNAELDYKNPKSFGSDISSENYSDLSGVPNDYVQKINNYQGTSEVPERLFNHKARYHNHDDLWIYKNLVPGKYLNDPENKKALEKVKYGIVVDKDGNRKVSGFADKYFKLAPDKVSKTIIAHLEVDGNSYVHPDQVRSITPREAARIQSFPDWYRFTGTTRNQFRQIGNAVPPLLAFEIASILRELLETYNLVTRSETSKHKHEEKADVC